MLILNIARLNATLLKLSIYKVVTVYVREKMGGRAREIENYHVRKSREWHKTKYKKIA